MYGHSPRFSVLNAEVDSMGGVVDGGVSVDDKASPRRAAIEKAQAELQEEYYVREERKRELEFLEKGGNPLDFKFGPTISISVQSTSLTDQLLDYDAKGSSVLATSPHGDSVDSSGRRGATVGREQNTADNILLIDGQNNNHDGTRSEMRSGKRKIIASSEHFSKLDGNHLKESEESGVFRLKSQAYARRNRSRPTRDSAHVGSAHLAASAHGNNSSVFPSIFFNSRDKNGPLLATQVEDHALSSISNSKPASPCSNNVSRVLDTGDQVEMDLDAVEVQEATGLMLKVDVAESETEVTTSSHLQQNDCNDKAAKRTDQQCPNGTISLPSEFAMKETISVGAAAETFETEENSGNASKAGPLCLSTENVTDLLNENQINIKLDGQMVGEVLASSNLKAESSNVTAGADSHITEKLKLESDSMLGEDTLGEKSEAGTVNVHPAGDEEPRTVDHELLNPFVQVKNEELYGDRTDLQSEERHELSVKEEGNCENMLCDTSNSNTNRSPSGLSVSVCEPSNLNLSQRSSSVLSELQIIPGKNLKLSKKACEDAILKEARIIEGKLKRINELSLCIYPSEKRRKSHWDYVIEEMAWLANDFTQERLWKISAASQISRLIASSGRSWFEEKNLSQKQRKTAHSLAKAIMSFWHLAEVLQSGGKPVADVDKECNSLLSVSCKSKGQDAAKKQDVENLVEESSKQAAQIPILTYAVRFLKCNHSCDHPVLAEAPATPERICDAGVWGMALEDQSSEESLFYLVPAGAMHLYRESIESRWLQHEKTSNTMHREGYEASTCDSLAVYGSRENTFEEDEAETDIHYLPGVFKGNKSKCSHKKKKTLHEKSYGARSYEVRSDLSYGPYLESKLGNQPSLLIGKRPATFNVCSIPTKKMRTASRQRVASPFSAGNAGAMQITSKTDVSSGDTSSFQDDQSSMQCGSQARKNAEIESTADFEKNLLFDGSDMSKRSKKKKKPKHTGYKHLDSSDGLVVSKVSSYEHRWQVDPIAQQDQKDHLKNRLENLHFDPNGSPGLLGQHAPKKLKLLKQLPEASPESISPISGSIPSPAASQMSSMSNPSKLIKMITSRDRGRKSKTLKIAAGQLGSGGSWSQFEDQALVVLVHDMGPNWELVSDAINSTLQFKCIFRKPNECKERHRVLMERSAGDGADSAEDSGSSQSYPSTLPGIPKGSARQLFQRLQGPMEEDTLKAHFEKIILIGRQLHFHRNQSESKEVKQITPVHNSHLHALSQACLNNLAGNPLTPLDLCEIPPSPEALSLRYLGSQSNALPTHPGALAPVMHRGANSLLQGSPSLGMNNGLSSPSAPPIAHTRDSPRYGVPRATFPVDEQQRMQQQYSQMLSNRNVQQSSMSVPGTLPMGPDRSVRMLSGGNNMGMMCGMNSGMPLARPGFQGIGSPSVLNVATSGSMLSTGGVGMSNPVNMHSNTVPGQENSLWRPHDHLQMQRSPEDHKQIMMQELHLQVTQGNFQSVTSGNGVSTPFSSQGAPPSPIPTFSAQQHQQPHQMSQPHLFGSPHHSQIQVPNHMSSQQQAYAIRLAKERQQQQRRLLHQQQHFSASNALPPSQNSSQMQQQSESSSVRSIPSSQVQHKQQNIPRNPLPSGGISNQMLQRQRQQLQQQQPRHQQQRQQTQQQGSFSRGLGGGNMLMHQNVPVDASHVNAPSTVTSNQINETHLLQQGQGFFSGGSGSGSALPQSSSQQKIHSRTPPRSSKTVPPISSHPDTCNQSMVQVPPCHPLMASHQSSLPLPLASQQQQRQPNNSPQVMQRMKLQANQQMNSDGQIQSVDQVQVNQMMVMTPVSQCTDPGNAISVATSAALSASQWKPEPSFETAIPAPSVQLPTSPQQILVGTEAPTVPSCQGLAKRQFSGSLPMHVHGIGGQWQQSKLPQQQLPQDHQQQHQPPQHQRQQQQSPHLQQQQQQQLLQHQLQHRQSGLSALYVTPSNSGPG